MVGRLKTYEVNIYRFGEKVLFANYRAKNKENLRKILDKQFDLSMHEVEIEILK